MRKKKIITMIGTSLIENYKEYNKTYYNLFNELCEDNQQTYESIKNDMAFMEIKNNLLKYLKEDDRATAEQASCFRIMDKLKDSDITKNLIQVHLLCSDTFKSEILAYILEEYFNFVGINAIFNKSKYRISGLQVDDSKKFEEEGVLNLFDILHELHGDYDQQNNLIINATGGYKGVIPYLTIYGQIYKIPVYYYFRDAEDLLELPQFELEMDYTLLADNLMALSETNRKSYDKRLTPDEFKKVLSSEEQAADIEFKKLLDKRIIEKKGRENRVSLTALGKMYYNSYQQRYKGEEQLGGELVELKLYEYLNNNSDGQEICHSVKLTDSSEQIGEIDILLKDHNRKEITIIEVKPGGGNIKYEEDLQKKKIGKALPYFINNCLSDKEKSYKIKYHIYLYKRIAPVPIYYVKEDLIKTSKLALELCHEIKWFWIKYNPREQKKSKINESMIELYYEYKGGN